MEWTESGDREDKVIRKLFLILPSKRGQRFGERSHPITAALRRVHRWQVIGATDAAAAAAGDDDEDGEQDAWRT